MACTAVITGDQFVTRMLGHIDCQAQYLGSYGYQSLAQPGSMASVIVSGLLTLFVALWGVRLLFGPTPAARDLIGDLLKIGIVLTLAFSWPAFRTVIHDVVLTGPAQIAGSLTTPGLEDTGSGFVERLQAVDNAIVSLTERGTGRRSGQFIGSGGPGSTFAGTTLEDDSAFGTARLSFLVGMFGSLALLRVGAGLLLALTPIAAGLLLFGATRSLFWGWVKGLVFAVTAAVAVTFTIAIELAMLEPWLADALRVRSLGYATPSAPIELVAMTLAFALTHFAILWLMARVCFHSNLSAVLRPVFANANSRSQGGKEHSSDQFVLHSASRAQSISSHIETRVRKEQLAGHYSRLPATARRLADNHNDSRQSTFGGASGPTTSSARRRGSGTSLASARRELGQ